MNRFFSKLDLRDIKIDPNGSRFPPDEEDTDGNATGETVVPTPVWAVPEPAAPVWSGESVVENDTVNSGKIIAATTGADRFESDVARCGEILKVSARSRPSAVAGAIAGVVRESGRAEVQAIGAGATNQAVKAVAIARDYLRETGIEAVCLPAFIDVQIDNEDRTAMRLVVEPR